MLDFPRRNMLPSMANAVGLSAMEIKVAVAVERANVAGVKDSFAQTLTRCFRIAAIAREDRANVGR